MDLNDITFQLTRASLRLKGFLAAGDIAGAKEICDEIGDLMLPLGTIATEMDNEINARMQKVSERRKAF